MKNLKKIYEVQFQYTTYNRLYVCTNDILKVESKLKDLNLNLSFKLDDESFSFDINRDLILVHNTSEISFDELPPSIQKEYINPPYQHLKESVLKNFRKQN
jgi:hypothetical protein